MYNKSEEKKQDYSAKISSFIVSNKINQRPNISCINPSCLSLQPLSVKKHFFILCKINTRNNEIGLLGKLFGSNKKQTAF